MNLISHEISHEKAFVLAGFRVVAFSKYHTKSGGPPGDRKPAIIMPYSSRDTPPSTYPPIEGGAQVETLNGSPKVGPIPPTSSQNFLE